jgi:hypothetical protein
MDPKKPEPDVTTLFASAPEPDPALAPTLEARLLARFDTLHPTSRHGAHMFASPWKSVAFASVLLFALGAASQAPVDYSLVVGKRIELVAPTGEVSLDLVEPMVQAISASGDTLTVETRGKRDPATNSTTLEIELWGNTFPEAAVEPTLRAQFPQLANARIVVQPLSGTVQRNLAGLVGEKLFHAHMTQAEVDAARATIIAKLRAQGVTDDITVDVQNDGEQVKVRAEKREVKP